MKTGFVERRNDSNPNRANKATTNAAAAFAAAGIAGTLGAPGLGNAQDRSAQPAGESPNVVCPTDRIRRGDTFEVPVTGASCRAITQIYPLSLKEGHECQDTDNGSILTFQSNSLRIDEGPKQGQLGSTFLVKVRGRDPITCKGDFYTDPDAAPAKPAPEAAGTSPASGLAAGTGFRVSAQGSSPAICPTDPIKRGDTFEVRVENVQNCSSVYVSPPLAFADRTCRIKGRDAIITLNSGELNLNDRPTRIFAVYVPDAKNRTVCEADIYSELEMEAPRSLRRGDELFLSFKGLATPQDHLKIFIKFNTREGEERTATLEGTVDVDKDGNATLSIPSSELGDVTTVYNLSIAVHATESNKRGNAVIIFESGLSMARASDAEAVLDLPSAEAGGDETGADTDPRSGPKVSASDVEAAEPGETEAAESEPLADTEAPDETGRHRLLLRLAGGYTASSSNKKALDFKSWSGMAVAGSTQFFLAPFVNIGEVRTSFVDVANNQQLDSRSRVYAMGLAFNPTLENSHVLVGVGAGIESAEDRLYYVAGDQLVEGPSDARKSVFTAAGVLASEFVDAQARLALSPKTILLAGDGVLRIVHDNVLLVANGQVVSRRTTTTVDDETTTVSQRFVDIEAVLLAGGEPLEDFGLYAFGGVGHVALSHTGADGSSGTYAPWGGRLRYGSKDGFNIAGEVGTHDSLRGVRGMLALGVGDFGVGAAGSLRGETTRVHGSLSRLPR